MSRLADECPHVDVLDWNTVARQNPTWLYDDGRHLTAPDGRRGYTAWLLESLGE